MAVKMVDGRTEGMASSDLEEFSFINAFCPPAVCEPTRDVVGAMLEPPTGNSKIHVEASNQHDNAVK